MKSPQDAANYLNSIYIDEETAAVVNEPALRLREWEVKAEEEGSLLRSDVEDSDVIEMYATPIVVYDVEQQSFRRYLEGDSSGYEPGEQLRAAVQDIHDIRDIRIEVDSFNDILARIPDDDYLEKIDRIF